MTVQLVIRLMDESDPEAVSAAFTALGWHKPPEMHRRYLAEQEEGRLLAFLAEWRGEFAGNVTLQWVSDSSSADIGWRASARTTILRAPQRDRHVQFPDPPGSLQFPSLKPEQRLLVTCNPRASRPTRASARCRSRGERAQIGTFGTGWV
jgi:hypothetical protein